MRSTLILLLVCIVAGASVAASRRGRSLLVSLDLRPKAQQLPTTAVDPIRPAPTDSDDPFVQIATVEDSLVITSKARIASLVIKVACAPDARPIITIYQMPITRLRTIRTFYPRNSGNLSVTWAMDDSLGRSVGRGVYEIAANLNGVSELKFVALDY